MEVRRIMSSPVFTIKKDATVREAAKVMAAHRVSGLPVVDDDERVIGIISESDLVQYAQKIRAVPVRDPWSFWVWPYVEISDLAVFRRGLEEISKTPVHEIMTKDVITVPENKSLDEVAKLMVSKRINRVPVVDDAGRARGIVSRADIVRYMAEYHVD